ncbi:MAG: aspartate/glutamate racemase family protein [Caldiserica bacterium]|jgi:allantoin racemase|nr:aspartate/glutamate racemase family protein [Caldisericota bacterium]
MKKIKVIIPVQTEIWTKPHFEELNQCKDADTEITVVSLDTGAESVENGYDDTWNALATILEVEKAEKEGFDGVIISCFGDPGLRAAKEAVKIPVVGVAEASIHLASMLGRRFAVITAGPPDAGAYIMDNFKVYEMDHKCIAVRSVGFNVLDLTEDKTKVVTQFVQIAKELIQEGAEVMVIGCTGMTELAGQIAKELPVPVINPAPAALKVCEDLVSLKISHSKIGYPSPSAKKRTLL